MGARDGRARRVSFIGIFTYVNEGIQCSIRIDSPYIYL